MAGGWEWDGLISALDGHMQAAFATLERQSELIRTGEYRPGVDGQMYPAYVPGSPENKQLSTWTKLGHVVRTNAFRRCECGAYEPVYVPIDQYPGDLDETRKSWIVEHAGGLWLMAEPDDLRLVDSTIQRTVRQWDYVRVHGGAFADAEGTVIGEAFEAVGKPRD